MTIQEIYNSQPVRKVEYMILDCQRQSEKGLWGMETGRVTIQNLLSIRKTILNEMFVMDDYYLQLLSDFNEAMKQQMIEMRRRTIALYESVAKAELPGTIEVEGRCFLGYDYPSLHPIQDERAKRMWDILNGTIDDYIPLYSKGFGQFRINTFHLIKDEHWQPGPDGFHLCTFRSIPEIESEHKMLYIDDELDNWNEGLDREMTKDLHLIYPFHDLFEHMEFSIFDLLWVRDFNIELNVEIS
jgi:hypothetical protein